LLTIGGKMLTIKCAKCNKKIMKYEKIGQGKVLRCYLSRIKNIYCRQDDNLLICECGNVIGIFEENWIKMKQHSFTYSGTKIK